MSQAVESPVGAAAAPTEEAGSRAHLVMPVVVGAAALLLALVGAVTTPAFVTGENVLNILRAAALVGIVALGMTFVTMSGNYFSLSVQQTAAFSAIGFAAAMSWGWPLPVAVLAVLALAALIGVLQGGIIAAGMNPIITTLGAGAALFGLAATLTDNRTVRVGSTAAEFLGRGQILGIPTQSWAFVLLTIVAALVLARTRFGRTVILVGANAPAATATGLNRAFVALTVFTVSSLGAGIAGVFLAAQIGQGIVNQFETLNIDAIAAVLVGGTAVSGGDGSVLRTAAGTLFIAILTNLMLLRGYPFGLRILLQGVAVIIGVVAYALLRSRGRS